MNYKKAFEKGINNFPKKRTKEQHTRQSEMAQSNPQCKPKTLKKVNILVILIAVTSYNHHKEKMLSSKCAPDRARAALFIYNCL